jgi:hypothetical protein
VNINDLVFDRTAEDVNYAIEIARKLGGYVYNSTYIAEYLSGLKGSYNASDLNRVEAAVEDLSADLRGMMSKITDYAEQRNLAWDDFFGVPYDPDSMVFETKTNWSLNDVPTAADMKRYLSNVAKLRGALKYATSTLPSSMENLNYWDANAIEKALFDLDAAIKAFYKDTKEKIDNTASVFIPCGLYFCGAAVYAAKKLEKIDGESDILGEGVLGTMALA